MHFFDDTSESDYADNDTNFDATFDATQKNNFSRYISIL